MSRKDFFTSKNITEVKRQSAEWGKSLPATHLTEGQSLGIQRTLEIKHQEKTIQNGTWN